MPWCDGARHAPRYPAIAARTVVVAAVLEPAAAQLGALGEPDQPQAGPGVRVGPKPTGFCGTTSIPVSGDPADPDDQQRPRRVLAGVGDASCDPVDRPSGRVRDQLADEVLGLDPHARALGLPDQARHVGVRRLSASEPLAGPPVAQDAEHAAQVVRAPRAPCRGSPRRWSASSSDSPSPVDQGPACIEIWEIRWARTSCISRAIRACS